MITPKPHLTAIHRLSERSLGRGDLIALDRNERVDPLSDEEFEEIISRIRPDDLCRYPEPAPLYEKLAAVLGVPQNWIYLTNGSDAALRMVFQTFVRPGDRVIFPSPSYAMYPIYAAIADAESVTAEYGVDRTLDIGQLEKELACGARLLVLANPDQPTGAFVGVDTIERLAANRDTLVIIDEAYHPFHPGSAIDLVRRHDNLMVVRSFSKAYGLAGLRLGFFVTKPELVELVERVRGNHEVNAVAIAAAMYLLDNPRVTEESMREIERGRRLLLAAADELGLASPRCPTNFQLLELPAAYQPHVVVERLKAYGYLVKGGFESAAVAGCIRVTLGGPATMEAFAGALRAVIVDLSRQDG